MAFSELPPLLTAQQAAVLLRVTLADVQAALADGSIPAVRVHDEMWVATRRLLLAMGADPTHSPLPADVLPDVPGRRPAGRCWR